MKFPVAIHKDEGSVYGVTVPDVPGCFSAGETVEQAVASAEEAITSHIETLLELGESVDVFASPVEKYVSNPDFSGAIWAFAEVDLSKLDSKPERVNVSLPRFVLNKIDQYTAVRHETRSGFLARAALELLTKEEKHATV